jgi:hypothetical protein
MDHTTAGGNGSQAHRMRLAEGLETKPGAKRRETHSNAR